MTLAIRFHSHGSPDVLVADTLELPPPGAGEVRIRHTAIGLNFIDVYQRSGLYKVPLPAIAGNEGAGVVEAVGQDVEGLRPGDRVAYGGGPAGAYCEARNILASRLVKLPDGISDETAAAMMLKGMTVYYLIRKTYPVRAGETVLFHAAAGGVGLIACQWLKALGVRVIGTAGSDDKCALAVAHGADVCINYRREDFVARMRELTGGRGVPVVYDSVGQATFMGSLDCLAPRGLMVSFGNASGAVPPFDIGLLSQKGSLFLTRPTLGHYTATRPELEAAAQALFEVVLKGDVRIPVERRYSLAEAARAHREMEARSTSGAGVLIP